MNKAKLDRYIDIIKNYDDYPSYVYIYGGLITRCLVVFGIIIPICCILPALLLYFAGYNERREWNDSVNKTECLITNYHIVEKVCKYRYSTYAFRYFCYDGFININLEVDNRNLTKEFKLYSNKLNDTAIEEIFAKKYSINSYTKCYYNKHREPHLRLVKKPTSIYLGFAITFTCFICIIPIMWIILEIIGHILYYACWVI